LIINDGSLFFSNQNAFESSIVEYDAVNYENAWVIIANNGFQCVLNGTPSKLFAQHFTLGRASFFFSLRKVNLHKKFPEQAPLLTLHSIYHVNQNRLPYKQVIQDYAYHSKWPISDTLESLRHELVRLVDNFKDSSKKEGKLNL
jgi:hypothetical protein